MKLKNQNSRSKISLLIFLLSVVFLCGCGGDEKQYPIYQYSVDYYCPDTTRAKMVEWIKETIRATDQHLSAGDYEDPEDVIAAVKYTATKMFSVRAEGLHKIKYEGEYMPEFIPQELMTDWEKKLYVRLRGEKHY